MADKTQSSNVSKDFDEFMKSAPEAGEAESEARIVVTGAVMKAKAADKFVLETGDGSRSEIPRAAVMQFATRGSGEGRTMVEVALDRAALGDELAGRLSAGGGLKIPLEKIPQFDTAKEIGGGDTIKEQPFDTLKEVGGGDTIKEQPFDTTKEIGGGDTLKEQPFDTLKEIGGGDTLKEQPFDTTKEIGGGDTIKEQPFDTLKELGGEGTGIADTLVEGIGQPGGDIVQPVARGAFDPTAAAMGGAPQAAIGNVSPQLTLKEQPSDTLKEQPFDTLKEIGGGDTIKEIGGGDTLKEQPFDTLKELGGGDTLKEQPFDTLKELGGEGTGVADTLVEGIGQPGGDIGQPFARAAMDPAAAQMAAGPQAAGLGLKPLGADTAKEVAGDHTLKEIIHDPKFIKEIVKEIAKEVAFEGTGPADTLVEGRPDFGIFTNPAVNPGLNPGMGGVPFVLATPHQASQGAVAQQMLAAQALAGRLGF